MQVDWADPSDKQVDSQLRRSKYSCKGDGCKRDLFASQLLLSDPDDWCGDLSTYCFGCSGWEGTEKAFMKEAKRRWTAYACKYADKAQRIRTLNFDNLEEYYRMKIPGVSKAEMKNVIISHLKLVATVVCAEISNESLFLKKQGRQCTTSGWLLCNSAVQTPLSSQSTRGGASAPMTRRG